MVSLDVKRLEWTLPVLTVAALLLAALILVPMGWLLYVSFGGLDGRITFQNFAALVRDPEMLHPLLLSLGIALTVSIACAVVASPLAWLVARTDVPCKRAIRVLVLASFVTPPFLGLSVAVHGSRGAILPGEISHCRDFGRSIRESLAIPA